MAGKRKRPAVGLTVKCGAGESAAPEKWLPIAEVKSRFSEYASRSAHGNEHFIITRRGKPLAALVSLDELAMLESMSASRGLATVMENWNGFEEVREETEEAYAKRSSQGEGRDVSL